MLHLPCLVQGFRVRTTFFTGHEDCTVSRNVWTRPPPFCMVHGRLALVFIEEQVGDPLGDREAPACLGADQSALFQNHLQQSMVEQLQEGFV